MVKYLSLLVFILIGCSSTSDSNALNGITHSMDSRFSSIVNNPDQYFLQIVYTQIDRDSDQLPQFTTHTFNVEPKKYFYPASTVKFPAAVLALDKLRRYESLSITKETKLTIKADQEWMSPINYDSTAQNGNATIGQFIKKIFVVSDNDAFNRLYEFLGQDHFNQRMWDLGYSNTRLRHRLSIRLTPEQNKYTNSFSFYINNTRLLDQPMRYSKLPITVHSTDNLIGTSYILDGKKIESPMDFSGKNFFNLLEQQEFLRQVIFPKYVNTSNRLYLTSEDYTFLYEWMSKLPRDSAYPFYDSYDKYPDSYCKFFMFGDSQKEIPSHIRIYNKVGMAYGFLIDNAYIIDIKNNIEFFLSAVVYVNENQTLNDDEYQYEKLGFPFLSELGKKVYDYELSRKRKVDPDLSRFILQ